MDEYASGEFRWWHLSEPSPELRTALDSGWLRASGRVLDVGCGLGTELAFLRSQLDSLTQFRLGYFQLATTHRLPASLGVLQGGSGALLRGAVSHACKNQQKHNAAKTAPPGPDTSVKRQCQQLPSHNLTQAAPARNARLCLTI